MTKNVTGLASATLTLHHFSVPLVVMSIAFLSFSASSTFGHVPPPIGIGPNDSVQPSMYPIDWTQTQVGDGHWSLLDTSEPQIIVADPTRSKLIKAFFSPIDREAVDPLLDLQPGWTSPVWEYFFTSDGVDQRGDEIPVSLPIIGWHEHILEPGWEWVVPSPESSDPALIIHDGSPWNWEYVGGQPSSDPAWLSVEFPAIEPGVLFVIHKQLRWIGTPENTVWGDEMLDDGSGYSELYIQVVEYPTMVPEPATTALALAASLFFIVRRRDS